MAGTALQTAHRAIVPTTLVLSGLTYLAALIASSVELDFMRALNTRLCAPPDRRTSTAPPPPGCHPYLVVPWALAAPTAALSLLFVAGGAAVHRHRRDQDRPAPRRALVVALALLLAGLWLAVLCVGWIRPHGAAVRYYVPARDLAIAVEGGPGVPLTGGFAWAVGFYQAIFADGSDLFLSAARMWQRTARTGLAGVILCNMAFAWAVIGCIVLVVYQSAMRRSPHYLADGAVGDKSVEEAAHSEVSEPKNAPAKAANPGAREAK